MFLSSSRRHDPDPPLVITYSSRRAQPEMRFPLLFAVPTDDARDRVSIFQATLLREGPDRWGDSPSVYLIAPYRIFHGHDDAQWPDEAFVRTRDGRAADERPNHDVLLVADYPSRPRYYGEETEATPERRAMYRGAWRHDAATVFSMYCSAAIPILRFIGHSYLAPWPTARFNRLPLIRASPDLVRAWVRRWDPASWTRDVVAAAGGASSSDDEATPEPEPIPSLLPVAAATTHLPPAVASQAVASQAAAAAVLPPAAAALPTFVAAALIADAVRRDLACPITMEPINPDSATVTPCYHVFDADALSAWVAQQLASGGEATATCPVCKVHL